jgi:ribonuclease Z
MSARELVVLGTSSQVPTRARSHNACFLAWDDLGILFDPGEGTQRQLIHAGIAPPRITHVCITHFHGDHCLGVAGIFQRLSLDRVPHPVTVVYPASGEQYLQRLRYASIYWEQSTVVQVPISEEGEVLRAGAMRLFTKKLEHGVECFGYRLEEDDSRRMDPAKLAAAGVSGPKVGELLRNGSVDAGGKTVRSEDVSEPKPGQRFAFVMDTKECDGARALAKDADLAVIESTYLHADAEEALSHRHMTAVQSATLAKEAGVRRLALTHFSQRYQDLTPFREEASAIHPDVVVCEDLVHVAVPPRR